MGDSVLLPLVDHLLRSLKWLLGQGLLVPVVRPGAFLRLVVVDLVG